MAWLTTRGVALGAVFAALAFPVPAWAQSRPCGCYCGKWLPAPCSDNACKLACGWQPPASSGGVHGGAAPSIDYEAERRAKEEAERQREQAERLERERIRAERQRHFERERDAAAKSLKGGGNTPFFGLKGVDAADSGLRAPGERVDRDLAGRHAAWKQLHCAASILGPALAAINPPPGKEPDFAESRYLLGEAQNALNGDRLGVQCSAAPAFPEISGRAPDMVRAKEGQRRLIARASAAVDKLEQARRARTPDEERIAQVYAQQQANQEALDRQVAPIREEQRRINRERERKPEALIARQEKEARQELDRIAAVAKKLEQGDSEALTGMTIEVEVEKPKRRRAQGVAPQ